MKAYDETIIAKIIELRSSGKPMHLIGKEIGIGKETVRQIILRHMGAEACHTPQRLRAMEQIRLRREWVLQNYTKYNLVDAAKRYGCSPHTLRFDEGQLGIKFNRGVPQKAPRKTKTQVLVHEGFNETANQWISGKLPQTEIHPLP